MTDQSEAIQELLVETENAHGAYEAAELNGVYDEDWPRWYASYAIEHGLGELVDGEVTTDRLADLLARGFHDFKQAQPEPSEPWSAYLARRIAAEL